MKIKYYLTAGLAMLSYPFLQVILWIHSPKTYRFYNLHRYIRKAYKKGDYRKAKQLAQEYLKLAENHKDDWNYGNAIHMSHQVLGLIQLHEGDIEQAKHHLFLAGQTPGSPQLNSYGPRMILARELLQQGERDVVIEYLECIAKFWATESDDPEFRRILEKDKEEQRYRASINYNKALIKQWKDEIRHGKIPSHKIWH